MKTWTRRLTFGFLAASVVVWLSGCLNAGYFFMARYDEAKDEFAIMNVYQQIASGTPGDSEYLYQLWLNRDHLIRVPNIDIFSMPAFVRLSARQYAFINLGQASAKLDPQETGVSLDRIRVTPGTFFLRGPDTLCYYDQVVVPGTVIDQVLASVPKAIAADLTQAIDNEIKRREDGGKLVAWEKSRELMLKQIHAGFNPAPTPATSPATAPETQPAEEPSNLLWNIDNESLQLWRRGVTDDAMKFTRDKQVFHFVFPLSNADVRHVDRFWRAGVDAVGAEAAKPADNAPISPILVAKILTAFTLTAQPRAVELKIDLAVILKNLPLLSRLIEPLAKPAPESLPAMRATIAALTAHGVPIDDKITVEQLARDFMADTLKSYPSPHPVTPGSGLVQETNKQGESQKPQ